MYRSYLSSAIFTVLAGLTSASVNAAQIVAPPSDSEVIFSEASTAVNHIANYNISGNQDSTEVGLGLRIHFDSSKLSFSSLSDVLQDSLQVTGDVQDDISDYDNDASTDKFLAIAWIDISGQWPGAEANLPMPLLTGNFTASNDFSGVTKVNFSASSTSGGADFSPTSQIICGKPEVSIAAENASVVEGSSTNITVSLNQAMPQECGDMTVALSVGGDATEESDYQAIIPQAVIPAGQDSASIAIVSMDDPIVESNEAVQVAIIAGPNYTMSQAQSTDTSIDIVSDDSEFSIAVSPSNIAEGDENSTAVVTVTRTGYLDSAVDVTYELSGSATQSVDFSTDGTGTLQFAAAQSSASFNITVLDDDDVESSENVIATLQASNEYQLSANNTATLSITDTDEMCIDIDGNGTADALTDGLTLARYLLGYRGETLINNSIGQSATRDTAAAVEAYIEMHSGSTCYDIDGNGRLDALTDAILLMRYLLNYQGNSLTDNAVPGDATRTTSESIENYISSLIVE